MRDAMHVFVVEHHPIFRRGLAEVLRSLGAVASVTEAGDVAHATADGAFTAADLVFVDHDLPGAGALLRELGDTPETHVIVLLARDGDDVLDAVQAGAIGFLSKDTLTPEALAGAVHAAANGTTVIAPGLLAGLAHRRITGAAPGTPAAARPAAPGGANGNGNGNGGAAPHRRAAAHAGNGT